MHAMTKERVLLVDDEPQVLVALEDLLSKGFTILKTSSPEEALGLLSRDRDIAVVITDQRMPQMTGAELLAKLRSLSDAQRILITGYADLSAVVHAVNDGRIAAYVTKPWDPEDLRFKVHAAAERFRLTKNLVHERQLLHDLMNNVPDGIYFKDLDLKFHRANRAFAAMIGASDPRSITGKRNEDVFPADADAVERDAEERRVLANATPVLDVMREYKWKGAERVLSETKAPILGPDGVSVGLVGIARDVTRQRNLERQVTQGQKMEAIGRLAGGVAHDFNNLLAVIVGYIELALTRTDLDSELREDLDEVLAASHSAAGLTRQLLAFGRAQVLQPRTVQLNGVVADLGRMLRRIIGEDIDLVTRPDPALGTIRADPAQLEQVVVNLTVNARDAMPNGGTLVFETTNVSVTEEHPAYRPPPATCDYVALRVTDDGIGMDAETQRRIFEPFFTTKPIDKGTGLGLSTVYAIVQQCGGHVTVESEPGRGTSFTIYLPRMEGAAATPSPSLPKAPSLPEGPVAGSGTVLLVEDDEPVRKLAARILSESGYEVLEARRGSEARRLCAEHGGAIDLLLTDVVMPDTSGVRLAAELTAAHPNIRVLYMSGYPGTSIIGVIDANTPYIDKPFSPMALAEKIREILGVALEAP